MNTKTHKIVIPGQHLGPVSTYNAGHRTYVRDSQIYASQVGRLELIKMKKDSSSLTIQVNRCNNSVIVVPAIGSVIIGKVTRVNTKFATVKIMVVNSKPCTDDYLGLIRLQDVRDVETDKIHIYKSFRPGDVVRANVISLCNSRFYYLSTASADLGVIFAECSDGHAMIPIAWDKMMCQKTKSIEYRKCAKPKHIPMINPD